MNFIDYCSECDTEIEVEEPQTCYYSGLVSFCGACPNNSSCFKPLVCDVCQEENAKELSVKTLWTLHVYSKPQVDNSQFVYVDRVLPQKEFSSNSIFEL